jgi:pimeloyl-ACP methyl ester carboxylesterase
MFRGTHEQFASDVAIEAEAEATADATELLPTISVPVLLIVGDEDRYFPVATVRETARLIPDCTLKLRPGAGHMRVAADPQGARDVLEFAAGHQEPAPA